jgi:hypothetical protein
MNRDLPVASDSLDNIPLRQISKNDLLSWVRSPKLLSLSRG